MKWNLSVVSNFLWPCGLQPTRLLRPWDSSGKNTGVGSLSLLQGIFPIQGSNSGLPHGRQMLYQLSNKESPRILEWGEQKSWPKLIIQKTKIMASSSITSWQIHRETMVTVTHLIFLVSKITADGDCSHEHKRHLLLGRKAMRNLDSILKSRDITLPTRVCIFKAMVLFSSYVWIWELAHKEGCVLKNWCFWTVVLGKTLKSPLDCKQIKPVNPKAN